jgi:hypothetical protein
LLGGWSLAVWCVPGVVWKSLAVFPTGRGQGSVPSRVFGCTIQPSFEDAGRGIFGQVDRSWGHGCGQVLIKYGMAHGRRCNVEVWPGPTQRFFHWDRVMSGQDYGDETKTTNRSTRQRGEGSTLRLSSWSSRREGTAVSTYGCFGFERDGQPQSETWSWIGRME